MSKKIDDNFIIFSLQKDDGTNAFKFSPFDVLIRLPLMLQLAHIL